MKVEIDMVDPREMQGWRDAGVERCRDGEMAQSHDGRHSMVQVRRLPFLPPDAHSCEPMVLQREALFDL